MNLTPRKQSYLIGYNYGQGGLWAYVLAESPQQIKAAFPFVEVFLERPPWLSDAILTTLRTYDVDKPEGWLAIGDENER